MTAPERAMVNLLSDDPVGTSGWFVELLGFEVGFESDWFVNLRSPVNPSVEIGILRRDHDLVPNELRSPSPSPLLTVQVNDVEAVFAAAQAHGDDILEAPRNLFYGQRRMLVRAPNGTIVDVSSPCEPDPQWLAAVMADR